LAKILRVLLVEDSDNDTELLLRELRKGGFTPNYARVDTAEAMEKELKTANWDIIISDYSMPNFDGISALQMSNRYSNDTPFIIVSANIGEEIAVMAMKAGAHDYIMKGKLARLVPAIEREIKESKIRARHRGAEKTMYKLSHAIEQTTDAVVITDSQGIIEYVNNGFVEMTGYSKEDATGVSTRLLNSGRHEEGFYGILWDTITRGEAFQDVFINRRKDGTIYYEEKSISPLKDEVGVVRHYISTGKDITEQMATRDRLQHMSHHDVLTGLPNRLLFNDRLDQAISRARRNSKYVAVILLDMDRFKNINETLGFETGDRILQSVAERLLKSIRDGDTVARLGDDEFAIVLDDVAHPDDISQVIDKIIKSTSRTYDVGEHELFVTTSMGISMYPTDGEIPQLLVQNADVAVHHAKESGSNNFRFYEAKMNAQSLYRLNLESSLRKALEREEFVLLYQPKVNLATGRISGFEALIRWRHPELGLISPTEFISLLEETSMIKQVGRWALREACNVCMQWQENDVDPISVAVNISMVQFDDNQIANVVADALLETGLPPELLELELTESTIMRNPEQAAIILRELGDMGVGLAIDDFGTGYSSLSYLQKFPINTLKIDRSFVSDIVENEEDACIVSAIISMAHSLNLQVVAEGVESEEQLEFLKERQCEYVQGFMVSKPVTESKAEEMLMEREEKHFELQQG